MPAKCAMMPTLGMTPRTPSNPPSGAQNAPQTGQCAQCGNSFKKSKLWQKFCNDKCSKLYWKIKRALEN